MNWLLTVFLCACVVETALKLPLITVVSKIASFSIKAMRTLASKKISDHWKEIVMLKYAVILFKSTINLALLLGIIVLVVTVIIFTSDYLGSDLSEFLYSWVGMIFSTISATAYYYLRKKIVRYKLQLF